MKKGRIALVLFVAVVLVWAAAGGDLVGRVMHRLYPRPYREMLFSHDFLKLSKNAFIEKRKIPRQQLCQFS